MSSRPEKRALIYESVIEYLKEQIFKGDLVPGSRLPTVSQLAEQLKVGLPSVREAYRILQRMGILEVTQGRGTFFSSKLNQGKNIVRNFTLSQKHSPIHLMEARKLLEPGIAALATQQATSAEINAIVYEAEKVGECQPSIKEYAEFNIKFHDLIASSAHNPVLATMLSAVHDLIREYQPLFDVSYLMENTINFHKLIAYAIQAKNPEAARALMYQHLDNAEQVLLNRKKGTRGKKIGVHAKG